MADEEGALAKRGVVVQQTGDLGVLDVE